MSQDRFITFTSTKPTRADLRTVLEDFVGAAGVVDEDDGRMYARFPGTPTYPFRRIGGAYPGQNKFEGIEKRWFEVFVASLDDEQAKIDVITRSADPFTSALAQKFAELVAHHWSGGRED